MKYFVKYLIVNEGIKNENKVVRITDAFSRVFDFKLSFQTMDAINELKKVKPFLCNHDKIEIGDKFTTTNPNTAYQRTIFECTKINNLGEVISSENTNERGWHTSNICKVIGVISDEAIWLQEGEKLNESQIKREVIVKEYDYESDEYEYTRYNLKGSEKVKLGQYENYVGENPIKVKCSNCKVYH